MGRIKRGLDYFPLSTSFMHDRIVRRIMKREGDSAFATLVETLSYIYAGKGYYVSADDELYDELADSLYSTDVDDVKRVVGLSVEYGFFDAALYRQYGILTSADIQRQYLFITKRRSSSLIEPDYCLLDAEEVASYRSPSGGKSGTDSKSNAEVETDDATVKTPFAVTSNVDSATMEAESAASGTQNKEKQIKTKQSKTNRLPNPPQGGNDGGGNILKVRKALAQEDVDLLQPPSDGTRRNFEGLVENLRTYKIPPAEQYAIILKSNFGAIGDPVWKGLSVVRDSHGKIKLPGRYLLSVIN